MFFVNWKESKSFCERSFWKERQVRKVEKMSTIQTNSKVEKCKKIVMKIALETEKKIVKNRKQMLRKKVLIQLIDFDFGKSR